MTRYMVTCLFRVFTILTGRTPEAIYLLTYIYLTCCQGRRPEQQTRSEILIVNVSMRNKEVFLRERNRFARNVGCPGEEG